MRGIGAGLRRQECHPAVQSGAPDERVEREFAQRRESRLHQRRPRHVPTNPLGEVDDETVIVGAVQCVAEHRGQRSLDPDQPAHPERSRDQSTVEVGFLAQPPVTHDAPPGSMGRFGR